MLIKEKGEVSECKGITGALWPAHLSQNLSEITEMTWALCNTLKWLAHRQKEAEGRWQG